MNKIFITALLLFIVNAVVAQDKTQEQKGDTVVVPLARTSQIIFTIKDRSDLEILKHYNFQDMFQDILKRLEAADTTRNDTTENTNNEIAQNEETENEKEEDWSTPSDRDDDDERNDERSDDDDDEYDAEWEAKIQNRHQRVGKTWQSSNFDFGTNNYISDGDFPDADNALYSVRPWGSWYIAFNSTQRTRLARNFFLEWGMGISWYNFKFQKDDVMMVKTDDGVDFVIDTRAVDHIKSKLTATYLNVSLVPLLDLGDYSRKPRVWDGHGSEFRIGIGPYVGYRIGSRSKMVFKEDHHREKEKQRESFYLSNLRYGARFQIGFRSTDFFINYDINELFTEGKGPKLNAVSFGVIF
jgi:hypothetical protein